MQPELYCQASQVVLKDLSKMMPLSRAHQTSVQEMPRQIRKSQGAVVPNRELRVCLLDLWSFVPYYVSALAAALRANKTEATLASVRYHLDRDYFIKCGVVNDPGLLDYAGAIRITGLRRALKLPEYLLNLAMFAARFRYSKPDVLHVQLLPLLEKELPFELWFMNFAKRLDIPIVYTVHNVNLQELLQRGGVEGRSFRRAYHVADALICHGEAAKERLVREFSIPNEKIWVIPHGPLFELRDHVQKTEARLKLGFPPNNSIVLFQGVISPYKGIGFLLEAWRKVQQEQPEARLVIAGTGERKLLDQIHKQAGMLGIRKSVDLHLRFIAIEELPLFYEAADILVYPYQSGTTSGALMTGLGYRKPIVATNIPLFEETLRPAQNSELVPYGDVDALASSLVSLLVDAEKRERLGQGSTASEAADNNWDHIAKQTLLCYEAVLNRKRAAGMEIGSAASSKHNEFYLHETPR
jgi:glycosyltransferase involved in cell wall biosynthesis